MAEAASNALTSVLVLAVFVLLIAIPPANAAVEVCDGIDNDNDTFIDEDFTYLDPNTSTERNIGHACYGYGECSALGVVGNVECFDINTASCSTNPGGSKYNQSGNMIFEICDEFDNDCDQLIDEDFTYMDPVNSTERNIGQGCYGYGECSAVVGNVECFDTSTASCSTNPGGSEPGNVTEVCDGLDNDCEGVNDNGGDALCAENEYCYTEGYGCELIGDVNRNGVVDVLDLTLIGAAYGSTPTDPHWNPDADIYDDGNYTIDMSDIVKIADIITGS